MSLIIDCYKNKEYSYKETQKTIKTAAPILTILGMSTEIIHRKVDGMHCFREQLNNNIMTIDKL